MAKKRSSRGSKAPAARSKRRGRARAAPTEGRAQPKGVINAWEDDPGAGAQPSGGQVIQRPVPVLRDQPLPIRIVHPAPAPEAKPHPPGTAEFRYWTGAESLRRGADFWGALRPGLSWEVGRILPVDLDFGVGGLLYAACVSLLVNRFGQAGLAILGGLLLGLAYLMLAIARVWWIAPIAVTAIGLGFYALHNTLQTNATQMTPQARGTAVAIFSSAIYLGQTLGVAIAALVFDRFTAVPLFAATAVALPALAWWFARKLRRHSLQNGAKTVGEKP